MKYDMGRSSRKLHIIIAGMVLLITGLFTPTTSLGETVNTVVEEPVAYRQMIQVVSILGLFLMLALGGNYLQQKNTRRLQVLHDRIKKKEEVQRLVSDIASEFLEANENNIDQRIKDMLGKIGLFYEADICYVYQFNQEKQSMRYTHEWCLPGITSENQLMREIPMSSRSWWADQLQERNVIHITKLEDFPDSAVEEKNEFVRQKVKSFLSIPISTHDQIIGILGLDNVLARKVWNEEEIAALVLLSNLLAVTLLKVEGDRQTRLAREQALEASKAKSVFLSHMSHEIRTPMNGMLGFLQLMDETILDDQQREYMEHMKTSSETLLSIINHVLDMSKIESGNMELECIPMDLERTLQSAIIPIKPKAMEKGLSMEMHLSTQVPRWIMGDPTRLRQVFINLMNNAVKFTQKGYVALQAEVKAEKDDQWLLQFTVSATGSGMTSTTLDKLFQPFAQADPAHARTYGGTGLGLSIAEKLVHQMGGTIKVESRENKGTSFILTIPFIKTASTVATNQTSLANHFTETRRQDGQEHLKILVVEDQPMNRKLMTTLLQNRGYTCDVAESGWQALKAFTEKMYDLIFMDYQMPDIDGLKVTQAIRKIPGGKHPRIVALTGYAFHGEVVKCLEAGMDDYLIKPIDFTEVDKVLQRFQAKSSEPSFQPDHPVNKENEWGSGQPGMKNHLTEETIASLMYHSGFDEATAEELLRDGLDELLSLSQALREACSHDNMTEAGNLLHKMKGSSGNLRIKPLWELLKEVEIRMMNKQKPCEEKLGKINQLINELRKDTLGN